ncbi:hypothetical protein ACFIOY_00520 [Bradyrhizobium sp. TZ2]
MSASITRRDRSITFKLGSIGFQASDGFALSRMRVRQDGGRPEARDLFAAARMSPKRLIDLNREVRAFRDAVTDSIEKNASARP